MVDYVSFTSTSVRPFHATGEAEWVLNLEGVRGAWRALPSLKPPSLVSQCGAAQDWPKIGAVHPAA